MPTRPSLARLDPAEKAKIFGEQTSELPKKWMDAVSGGVPLFWQECKSQEVWSGLLQDMSAASVVDLTPGSGLLATACMELGIPYLGIVNNTIHLNFLANVLDRASLKYIVQSGHVLYQDDLATLVKNMFADIVEDAEEGEDAADLQSETEADALSLIHISEPTRPY